MPSVRRTPDARSNTLQAALDYAARGWPVTPGAVWHHGHFARPLDGEHLADLIQSCRRKSA